MDELIKDMIENLYSAAYHGECFVDNDMFNDFKREVKRLNEMVEKYEVEVD